MVTMAGVLDEDCPGVPAGVVVEELVVAGHFPLAQAGQHDRTATAVLAAVAAERIVHQTDLLVLVAVDGPAVARRHVLLSTARR